ncbi:hypothetical protein [Bifidobacterium eulemuris]|uniref:Uncharacterized protein n=1 Tax=Bifidobacterium eulemuris TaxID=1765219 RepID=A0A261GAD7_9BIFI|nr:hypothetical protein [Bifidobacterium eulemuris]OZG68203.1 hypothetical protein BEUL_1216 [Bifidobacterium eulemuris]QOL31740.1 hypothetical protein BE0216_04110 [Bifidobacterium eulemuris]
METLVIALIVAVVALGVMFVIVKQAVMDSIRESGLAKDMRRAADALERMAPPAANKGEKK